MKRIVGTLVIALAAGWLLAPSALAAGRSLNELAGTEATSEPADETLRPAPGNRGADPVLSRDAAPQVQATEAGALDWLLADGASGPPPRYGHAAAYDTARGRLVLFGGMASAGYLGDTWEWDGSQWLQRTPASSPSARAWHAMAFDSVRGRVVLFGGSGEFSGALSDTWEWDGNTWVNTSTVGSPPGRYWHAMAFDSARGQVVMFGGLGSADYLADTWEWSGFSWIMRTSSTVPSRRAGHAMAFDSARGRLTMFGGVNEVSNFSDTWEWDGSRWNAITPSVRPAARGWSSMAFDSFRGRIVLFGGFGGFMTGLLADTWEWDGTTWVRDTPTTSPAARYRHAMAYDVAARRVWLFGGAGNAGFLADTWKYGPTNQPPVADAGPDQAFECTGGQQAIVTLDGSGSSDADSTPGTNDDIVSFQWSEGGSAIASGQQATASLPLGVHDVSLTVTDKAGATGTDEALITVGDTTPPTIACPEAATIDCQSAGQAQVALPPAVASDACYGTASIVNDRTPGGPDASGSYPLGSTTVTFTATDGAGNAASCVTTVTVGDTTPPIVTVRPFPAILWIANHRMVPVLNWVVVLDSCGPASGAILQSVVSSEPDDAPGPWDGHSVNDIQGATLGTADFNILLRAERDVRGPGRTYTIQYQATDGSGNVGTGRGTVFVPRARGPIVEPDDRSAGGE